MTQVRQRPVVQKTGILTRDERKYMDSFRHAPMCEGCYRPNDGTVVGAHMNSLSGGSGRGLKARGAIVGLCRACHDLIDWRVEVTEWNRQERTRTLFRIAAKLARDRSGL